MVFNNVEYWHWILVHIYMNTFHIYIYIYTYIYIALNRLGIHDHFIQVINNCYRNPCFFVEDEFGKSLPKRQRSGIRQGCPLSPYLFVLVMSVIDNDVNYHLDRRTLGTRKPGISFDRIYYADDTVLLATNTYSANRILWAVARVSLQFGLKLNRGKCSYIAMNGNNNLRFANGTKLCRRTETTYLGHHITQSMNIRQEIGYIMQQTMAAWTKLKPFLESIHPIALLVGDYAFIRLSFKTN